MMNVPCITTSDVSPIEIPYFVAQSIESWSRILSGASAENAAKVMRMAAAELRRLSDKEPELFDTIEQALADLSNAAGVDIPAVDGARVEISTPFETAGWPEPSLIKSTLPTVEPFISELLPEAIRDYVIDVADRQQAPPDFTAVAALCGIAAVVGNRVRIRPKQNDDWQVVPNLWGATLAWKTEKTLQGHIAEVIELRDNGRVSLRFDNGRLLLGQSFKRAAAPAREPRCDRPEISSHYIFGLAQKLRLVVDEIVAG